MFSPKGLSKKVKLMNFAGSRVTCRPFICICKNKQCSAVAGGLDRTQALNKDQYAVPLLDPPQGTKPDVTAACSARPDVDNTYASIIQE